MRWQHLLTLLGQRNWFDASILLAGPDSPREVRRQLSRWTASGRLIQIRRGFYALAPPWTRTPLNLLAVAARIRSPSYVSLQSALSFHGVIPESAPVVTSVTTGRPGRFDTPLGPFFYRHVSRSLFWGYLEADVGDGERGYVAHPEKALLDLFHLTPGAIGLPLIRELRLAPDALDPRRLGQFAQRGARPKLTQAAALTIQILEKERKVARRL